MLFRIPDVPFRTSSVALGFRALWLSMSCLTLTAAHFDRAPILSLTEENDLFNGTDRWYTQGARLSFLQGDNELPGWLKTGLDNVPALGFAPEADRVGYEVGQSIFTPANTHTSSFLPDDRPYAGWLYAGVLLQRRGLGRGGFLTLENVRLDLGMIGPESFADHIQTWYHHHAPRGWEYQLQDEPGVALQYGRAWLIPVPSGEEHYFDMIPQAGLSAGNVDTSFRVGTTFRVGWHLPEDFGAQPIHSLLGPSGGRSRSETEPRWGFYFFSGVEGRAVLYTTFLDGNSFRESHHVDKEPFVGEWRSGLVLVLNRIELVYSHIFRTREFRPQPEGQGFGSVTLQLRF